MVATVKNLLKRRISMLQLAGIPFVRFAVQHTYLMMWILRLSGIMENGWKGNGRFPMEISASIQGKIGQYKINFWSCPVYRDCCRWSLAVVKI